MVVPATLLNAELTLDPKLLEPLESPGTDAVLKVDDTLGPEFPEALLLVAERSDTDAALSVDETPRPEIFEVFPLPAKRLDTDAILRADVRFRPDNVVVPIPPLVPPEELVGSGAGPCM